MPAPLNREICLLILPVCFALSHCTFDTSSEKKIPAVKETKTGLASFYSHSFQGEKTANGEIFNNKEMVAAHPTYPFGTIVRVTDVSKGLSVVVRISDRGPTGPNRAEGVIIDLSRGAARKLGMMKEGRVEIKLEVLKWGKGGYRETLRRK